MADSRKDPAPNRAFVPPWQLQTSPNKLPSPSGLNVSQNRPPPVPPRNPNENLPRQPVHSPFSSSLSSSAGLPLFSGYSSPFFGGFPGNFPASRGGFFDAASASTHPLLHSAFQSASPAFQGVESLVVAVRSISIMVESTYQALHSSFNLIIGVADHFSKLKDHLVWILSRLSLLKLFKWIIDNFLTFLRLKQKRSQASEKSSLPDWSSQFTESTNGVASLSGRTAATMTVDGVSGTAASPLWPSIAFFGLALGAPWLLWKMASSAKEEVEAAAAAASSSSASTQSPRIAADAESPWSRGVGEHFVAKAEFDYRASAEDEISFQKDDLLKIAPKRLQSARGWYLASKDGLKIGLVPANHVEVLVKLEGKSRDS